MCLLARFVVVFALAAVVNRGKTERAKFQFTAQIICSYGGLRGAVAFSLAVLLKPHFLGKNGKLACDVLVTTTLVVILFTVAFMGITMKPLVRLLNIRLAKKTTEKLFVTLNDSVMEQTLLYIDKLTSGPGYYRLQESLVRLDDRYIRPFLQRDAVTHSGKIVEVYEKMALQLHSDAISSHAALEMPDESGETSKAPPAPEQQSVGDIPLVYGDSSANVTMRMPQHVRRRVNIASMLMDGANNMYLPRESIYDGANNAEFARIRRSQAHLMKIMDRGESSRVKNGWANFPL
nr:unnamed protein product [Spirometra erinaceieuropaei]